MEDAANDATLHSVSNSWGYGGEATTGSGPVGGYVSWQTGTSRQTLPPAADSSRAWLYGSGAIQYFLR